jgi:beta-1,4-mannosyltransferase
LENPKTKFHSYSGWVHLIYFLVYFVFILFYFIFEPKKNPPAIPILAIGHVVCFLRGCKLLIDWHNFGWTILALSKPKNHWTVTVYKAYEKFFGRGAFANFCVTQEMQKFLKTQWKIEANVLYDKPAKHFRRLNLDEMHEVGRNIIFSTFIFMFWFLLILVFYENGG